MIKKTAAQLIEETLSGPEPFPSKILVPKRMYEEFAADRESTGHSKTVWGVPVEAGNVEKITHIQS